MKHLIKNGRKIQGFVWQDKAGLWWCAFGSPSQAGGYMAIGCKDLEDGITRIKKPAYSDPRDNLLIEDDSWIHDIEMGNR